MPMALSVLSKLKAYTLIFGVLPVVVVYSVITKPFFHEFRRRPWRRHLIQIVVRFLTKQLDEFQVQHLTPPSLEAYKTWCQSKKVEPCVEPVGEDTDLMWIGPRRTDRVMLNFPGGAYLTPVTDDAFNYWEYVRKEQEKQGVEFGMALVHYKLVPDGVFPTQIRQAVESIQHLLDNGTQPQNIYLSGDSAGGHLVISLLSHLLHPIEGVPVLKLSSPLAGVCLLSPWICMTGNDTWKQAKHTDLFDPAAAKYWGATFLRHVPNQYRPYTEVFTAPKDWLAGVDKLVSRFIVTAGELEVYRHDIERFVGKLRRVHTNVKLDVQDGAIHVDPQVAFMAGESDLGPVTPMIVDWFVRKRDEC